jgi:hypothetical protein
MIIVYSIEANGCGYHCGWDASVIEAFAGLNVWIVPGTVVEEDDDR